MKSASNCQSHNHQLHLKGSQYGEPSQMAMSSWWHLRWADQNPGETLRSQIRCRPDLRCNAALCLASWSSDAMQATMSPAASMDGIIPPVTELYHLSVGHWLQPAGFWVQQWWAMKNPTQDTHIITSICWSLIITNYHIIPNHTVALTALKLNIESSKYYVLCFPYASVPALDIYIAYRISKEQ